MTGIIYALSLISDDDDDDDDDDNNDDNDDDDDHNDWDTYGSHQYIVNKHGSLQLKEFFHVV